jgi:dTDP-4-amino-4,6-dideoxygalactose transaminase
VQVPHRETIYNRLRDRGIYSQVHYIPVCDQPYYVSRYGRVAMPRARAYYEKALSLPMYPSLSEADQAFVISSVLELTAGRKA